MSEKEKKQKDLFAYKAVLSAFLFKADHLSMVRLPRTRTLHRRRRCVSPIRVCLYLTTLCV